MIALENVSKSFGRSSVLKEMNLAASAGSLTLMIGDNGAGKTTALKILAGLEKPDRGQVLLEGIDRSAQITHLARKVAYLPQGLNFHPRLRPIDILKFYARLRGRSRQNLKQCLERVGLAEFARRPCGKLSGGMRQRLGLAYLLLSDAPVLLLDEPGLSLDPTWRAWMQQTLRELRDKGDKTILVTTHLLGEWNGVADRVLLCRSGKIESELASGQLDQLSALTSSRLSTQP